MLRSTVQQQAALPAALAPLPCRLFFEFPFKDICPLLLPRGQQLPAHHLSDRHSFSMAAVGSSSLLSVDAQPRALSPCRSLAGDTRSGQVASPPPALAFPLRFAFLQQRASCRCAFWFLALLVKFIVVKRPEHTGRERQLPSISSLRKV